MSDLYLFKIFGKNNTFWLNNKKYFTTKGDNLKSNDPLKVKEEQIIGIIKFTIPKLGYPSVWLYELLK